jgi:hypothetical protein
LPKFEALACMVKYMLVSPIGGKKAVISVTTMKSHVSKKLPIKLVKAIIHAYNGKKKYK